MFQNAVSTPLRGTLVLAACALAALLLRQPARATDLPAGFSTGAADVQGWVAEAPNGRGGRGGRILRVTQLGASGR